MTASTIILICAYFVLGCVLAAIGHSFLTWKYWAVMTPVVVIHVASFCSVQSH